ncbi:hypothetical protein [Enterovirga aerilata]|uniref:Uncharacterized protein n=1 Tax=Enterovirga aerilata TaxID=2730920 RepID=A0A849ICF5_9HYPH|nr:hypothetical protein [Enterovirga sp. DB1703]NNM75088.1 hypothetical protein [Enterovirga sp. DB1703]
MTQTLPPLAGTPKQIAWAEEIRAAALAEAERVYPQKKVEAMRTVARLLKGENGDKERARLARYDAAMAKLTTETSANWWIDNRDASRTYVYDAVIADRIVTRVIVAG